MSGYTNQYSPIKVSGLGYELKCTEPLFLNSSSVLRRYMSNIFSKFATHRYDTIVSGIT